MAQLDCGGCRTRLMYMRGAASVQCSVCNTVNLVQTSQLAHCQCGGCGITLMYPNGWDISHIMYYNYMYYVCVFLLPPAFLLFLHEHDPITTRVICITPRCPSNK